MAQTNCSAWSKSKEQNFGFEPKQNTKVTLKKPPTENFLGGSRQARSLNLMGTLWETFNIGLKSRNAIQVGFTPS
jgi:hypothetical protein